MSAHAAGGSTTRRVGLQRSALIRQLRNVQSIREALEQARPYCAYALAYLDKRLFPMAEFYEASAGQHKALVMHSRGGLGPSTLTMGDGELTGKLLELHPGPRQAFLTCEPEHIETILDSHNIWRFQTMLRMQLCREDYRPPATAIPVRRLSESDADDLNRLYNEDGARYASRQIVEGVYFGAYHRDRLVAAAGTHIYSRREGVGIVGNVYTHPDFRSHGLGTAVTAAVTSHLLEGCDLVVLNVDPANRTARHIYEQLGFREAVRLVEGMASRRGVFSPLPLIRRAVARHRSDAANTELVDL